MIEVREQLSVAQYEKLRWNTLRYMEEVGGSISWRPYLDSANPPRTTIGVGFNIKNNTEIRRDIYELLGLDTTDFSPDLGYIV